MDYEEVYGGGSGILALALAVVPPHSPRAWTGRRVAVFDSLLGMCRWRLAL